jgi:xanthine dehydrogenase small subunit
MKRRLRFIVNDIFVDEELDDARPLLDFLRLDLGLKGTKEGCREGDCGACMTMIGEAVAPERRGELPFPGAAVEYRATTSCLASLGSVEGRHAVTIEGFAAKGLTPVMEAILEENGSQCGFCSPGFVVSIGAALLSDPLFGSTGTTKALEGNLCRCTGYGALRRAVRALAKRYPSLPRDFSARARFLADEGVVPESVPRFVAAPLALPAPLSRASGTPTGGGTDLYVRQPDPPDGFDSFLVARLPGAATIERSGKGVRVGAAVVMRDFFASPAVREFAPGIEEYEEAIASAPIRSRATVGGNVANASPIGDVTAMLVALGAVVEIAGGAAPRSVPIEDFFLAYKKLDLGPGEYVASFLLPERASRFSFEKVARRERLDIATTNTALALWLAPDGSIARGRLSLGGVAPVPLLAGRASAALSGAALDAASARSCAELARGESAPIGDVRGSAEYRLALVDRLVRAHFARMAPALEEELFG